MKSQNMGTEANGVISLKTSINQQAPVLSWLFQADQALVILSWRGEP
jgi:hypothetical protein